MNQTATVDTSIAAYEDIKPKAPGIRERVLQFVTDQNGMGVSRTQIAAALDINEITAGSRLTELLQAGKIKRKGETVLSTSGKPEHLYVLGDGVPQVKGPKVAVMTKTRFVELLRVFGVTSTDVFSALVWADQPEGVEFWVDVTHRLER
jgi:hypothetical protein